MGLRKIYDDVVDHARRSYSDDYDYKVEGVAGATMATGHGHDFEIKIGDVCFWMDHGRFDCTGFNVRIDGVHVMSYSTSTIGNRRWPDEPSKTTWHQDSPTLREHVKRAAVEVYIRHKEYTRAAEMAARRKTEKEARVLKRFKERFGINE